MKMKRIVPESIVLDDGTMPFPVTCIVGGESAEEVAVKADSMCHLLFQQELQLSECFIIELGKGIIMVLRFISLGEGGHEILSRP